MDYDRELISYYELPEDWQAEARSNNEDNYEDVTYIAPLEGTTPDTHSLLDLSECVRTDGGEFDGVIGVSNNSGIGVNISPDGDACFLTYL